GLLVAGELRVLALFDKPDPLDGPYFEETIYVTPSRLPADQQRAVAACAERAAKALGLREGPVHAELRVNASGPWVIELAVRQVEEVVITAHPGQELVPWPEGARYPGFIFARGETPDAVEAALRAAHQRLQFVLG